MHKKLKGFLKFASFPIGMFLLLYLGGAIWHVFGLPGFDEVISYAKVLYEIHGYWLVFVASLMEGTLLLNWYLPGSVVIITGTVFAIEGGQSVLTTALLVCLGLFITSIINYLLGRYGWYKLLLKFGLEDEINKIQKRIEKYGFLIMIISYIHPHTGSLVATSAGILQMRIRTFIFYTAFSYAIWACFWTILAYVAGPQFLSILDFKALLIIVALWIFSMGFQYMWNIRNNRKLVYATVITQRERIFSL